MAAVTAWALMEQEVGSMKDARMIMERGLRQFSSPPSEAKISLWNGYERMERNSGDLRAAANVEARKVRINVGGERDDCDVAVLVANTLLTS